MSSMTRRESIVRGTAHRCPQAPPQPPRVGVQLLRYPLNSQPSSGISVTHGFDAAARSDEGQIRVQHSLFGREVDEEVSGREPDLGGHVIFHRFGQ